MIKKLALVLAMFLSFSGVSFAGAAANDGSDDVIEAMGGSRSGGDC